MEANVHKRKLLFFLLMLEVLMCLITLKLKLFFSCMCVCVCCSKFCKKTFNYCLFSVYDNGSNLSYRNNRGVRGGAVPLNAQRRSGERKKTSYSFSHCNQWWRQLPTHFSFRGSFSLEAITVMMCSNRTTSPFSEELSSLVGHIRRMQHLQCYCCS